MTTNSIGVAGIGNFGKLASFAEGLRGLRLVDAIKQSAEANGADVGDS
jgi:hypothetical protein